MNVQTLTKPATTFAFMFVLPEDDGMSESQIRVSSQDYGFDFDEEEIARELFAPLPEIITSSTKYVLDANELEKCHLWFLS